MKKTSFTDHAVKLAIAELEKLKSQGHDPKAVINQTLLKGWKSFYPLGGTNFQKPTIPQKTNPTPAEIRADQIAAQKREFGDV
jgi:hypothetical protein